MKMGRAILVKCLGPSFLRILAEVDWLVEIRDRHFLFSTILIALRVRK